MRSGCVRNQHSRDSYSEEIVELCPAGDVFVENYKRFEFSGIERSIWHMRWWCIILMVMIYGRRIVVAVRLIIGGDQGNEFEEPRCRHVAISHVCDRSS